MENELENLKKIHQQDLDCITTLTEEIDSLREQLQNQRLNDLQAKKQELEKEIDNENFKIFMNMPRKPIVNEEKEEPKTKTLDEILMED